MSLDTGRDLRGRHLAGEDFSTADLRLANLCPRTSPAPLFTDADLSSARGCMAVGFGMRSSTERTSPVSPPDIDMEGASLPGYGPHEC